RRLVRHPESLLIDLLLSCVVKSPVGRSGQQEEWMGSGSVARMAGLCLLTMAVASRAAVAQVSLVGEWSPRYYEDQPDRIPGPELGDYTGLPLTAGARLAADSWDAARLTLREHQCKVHISPYIYHGPMQFRLWEVKDPLTQQVVAIKN